MLAVRSNLASTCEVLGRSEEALRLRRAVYSGRLKLNGKEHKETLIAALNFADSLFNLKRLEEVKSLLRRTVPVARRVLGENDYLTLIMRANYAKALGKGKDKEDKEGGGDGGSAAAAAAADVTPTK